MPYRISSAEYTRLSTLYSYGVLDTAPEPAHDAILRDLAASLRVPVAQLVFADARRFWAKGTVGPAKPESLRGETLADILISDRTTLVVPDASAPGRVPGDLPPTDVPMRSYAGIRIASPEGEAIGVLHVADLRVRDFTPGETAAIEAAAHAAAVLLESRRRACRDDQTGALQPENFTDTLRRMVAAARSGRQRISLVRLDIAAFRLSLEAMGTGLGRIALRRMADLGAHQVRRRDCFGRVGLDDFAVLLTDTGETGARVLADRLSRHLHQGWSEALPHTGAITVEVASVKPESGDDAEAVLLATLTRRAAADMRTQARLAG